MYLDQESLNKIKEIGGDSLLEKMVRLFLEHAPKNFQRAQNAKLAGDFKELSEAAHAIKSSSGNFGAHPLYEIAEQVEHFSRENKHDNALELMPEFEKRFQDTVEAMNTLLNEITS